MYEIVTYKDEVNLLWLTILKVSVHDWPYCFWSSVEAVQCGGECVVKQSCLPHVGQEAKRESSRDQGPQVSFEDMPPVT